MNSSTGLSLATWRGKGMWQQVDVGFSAVGICRRSDNDALHYFQSDRGVLVIAHDPPRHLAVEAVGDFLDCRYAALFGLDEQRLSNSHEPLRGHRWLQQFSF